MLKPASSEFKTYLETILPPAVFPEISEKYLTEPRGRYQGMAGILVAPDGTDQVSKIISAAARPL